MKKNPDTLFQRETDFSFLRLIALKGSSSDGKKQLLEALRRRFPEGTITLGVDTTSKDVLDFWHSLQKDYRCNKEEERVCMGTSCCGLQDNSSYWFLAPQVTILL